MLDQGGDQRQRGINLDGWDRVGNGWAEPFFSFPFLFEQSQIVYQSRYFLKKIGGSVIGVSLSQLFLSLF